MALSWKPISFASARMKYKFRIYRATDSGVISITRPKGKFTLLNGFPTLHLMLEEATEDNNHLLRLMYDDYWDSNIKIDKSKYKLGDWDG